nr:MAG TPA: hypothetical protein [Bacteriophage sp.]
MILFWGCSPLFLAISYHTLHNIARHYNAQKQGVESMEIRQNAKGRTHAMGGFSRPREKMI